MLIQSLFMVINPAHGRRAILCAITADQGREVMAATIKNCAVLIIVFTDSCVHTLQLAGFKALSMTPAAPLNPASKHLSIF